MLNTAISLITVSTLSLNTLNPLMASFSGQNSQKEELIVERQISLNKRLFYPEANQIYKDNILLNMAYMQGYVNKNSAVDWDLVRQPFEYEHTLNPGETFAFHEDVLDKYNGKIVKTTNAHFDAKEGFKSDGYLYGMGVCHLASLIAWASIDAGIDTEIPSNHNFAIINEIDKKYGVAIYSNPDSPEAGQRQNLYITNNQSEVIKFKYEYDGENLKVKILKIS